MRGNWWVSFSSSACFWAPSVPPNEDELILFQPSLCPQTSYYSSLFSVYREKGGGKRTSKTLWGGGGTSKGRCFLLLKQESGREATRWSLLQGKRVNIFGSNNREIAYCPRVVPGWSITWLEAGVVCDGGCGVDSLDLQERGMHSHRCS